MSIQVAHSQPKVLHIASGDLWAGAEVQLHTLSRSLHCDIGIPISVVLLNHGRLEEKLREAGIKVIIINEAELNDLQILLMLIRTIRDQSPDVVHTHRVKENILGSIAAFLAGRIPSLRTAHGAPEHRPSWRQVPKRLINTLDWFCGRFIQKKIIAVSEDLANILEKDYPESHIHVIENGIQIDSACNHNTEDRPTGSTGENVFKIAFAGRLVPVKRVDICIETARYTHDHHPDLLTSFHIFGDGPIRDELESLSQKLDTDSYVHFEGHCDDLGRKLHGMDMLLMTSDHEGLPMILLEAMALQVPVIAHAVGGIPALLDQGSCGILVREHNAAGYGEKIYQLARNQELRSIIRKSAQARINTCYSAERNANNYLLEYSAVTANRK